MNATTRTTLVRALALGAALAAGIAPALAESPTDVALGDCVSRAERYFGTRAADFAVRDADTFRMASGRRVLALDLQLGHGVNPRFYCVLDAGGHIGQVHTMPRLPGNADTRVVAK